MSQNYLGIEIGGTKLQLAIGGADAQISRRHRLTVDPSGGADGIRKQIEAELAKVARAEKPIAVGVGFGGPVEWQTGRICRSHQIEGWSEFDLGDWLRSQVDAPVFVDNDANVGALGEATHGAGRGASPVFYVTLGSGVGGGLVVDGRIYHGAKPGESEIGHIRLDKTGTIVEARCSGWAVDARIRALKISQPASILARMLDPSEGGEARHLAGALERGDLAARQILDETAEDLAFGLSHVAHLFHPEVIVLGGGLSKVGERLRSAVEKALRGFLMEVFLPGPRICLAELGEDAVTVGALELARERLGGLPGT
ncbi:MAG TPA: ROK family protein [Verrucomicrobiae bacterium]|nr:ROK family protein [Verrucomicrobiae bacterium]